MSAHAGGEAQLALVPEALLAEDGGLGGSAAGALGADSEEEEGADEDEEEGGTEGASLVVSLVLPSELLFVSGLLNRERPYSVE